MMIRPQLFLLACSLCLMTSVSTATADGPSQRPVAGGTNIALVDINYLFKKHEGFKHRAELIKKEVKDYEARVNEQRKVLNEKRKKLSNFNAGSPEYERLEAEIARELASIEVETRLKRDEILDKEAKNFFQTYQEITQAVAVFCSNHQIGLVLRYEGEPVDPNDRASVVRAVSRPVVYQNQIDITAEIEAMVITPKAAAKPVTRAKQQ